MISSHRTAFPLDKNKKKPVEQNLNTILNQCQIKMKEMILKKQDFIRKTNILAGKNNTLQEEISKLEKDIQDQRDDYEKKNELLTKKYEEINQNQLAYQEKIKEANEKEALFKEGINQINLDLEKIKYGTLAEQSQRRAEIKKKCEDIIAGKEEQTKLEERLYVLTRELGKLEIELQNAETNEKKNILRAQNGIETMNQLYQHQKEYSEAMKKYSEENGEETQENQMEEVEEENRDEKHNKIKENIDEEEPKIHQEVKPIEANNSHSDHHKSEENINNQPKIGSSEKETEAPKQTAEINTQEQQ